MHAYQGEYCNRGYQAVRIVYTRLTCMLEIDSVFPCHSYHHLSNMNHEQQFDPLKILISIEEKKFDE